MEGVFLTIMDLSIKELYLLKHHKCLVSGFIFKVAFTVTLKKSVLVGVN